MIISNEEISLVATHSFAVKLVRAVTRPFFPLLAKIRGLARETMLHDVYSKDSEDYFTSLIM